MSPYGDRTKGYTIGCKCQHCRTHGKDKRPYKKAARRLGTQTAHEPLNHSRLYEWAHLGTDVTPTTWQLLATLREWDHCD